MKMKTLVLFIVIVVILSMTGCSENVNLTSNQNVISQTTAQETIVKKGTIFSLPNLPKTIVGQIAGGYVDIVGANVEELNPNTYKLTMNLDVTKYKPGTTGMGVHGTYYYYVIISDSTNNEIARFNVESPSMLPGSQEYGKCTFSVEFPFSGNGNYKIDFVKEDFGF